MTPTLHLPASFRVNRQQKRKHQGEQGILKSVARY